MIAMLIKRLVMPRFLLLYLLAFFTQFPAIASTPFEGICKTPDYFYSYLTGGKLFFKNKAHAKTLQNHCKQRRPIFRVTDRKKFQCNLVLNESLDDVSNSGTIEIVGVENNDENSTNFALFSVKMPGKLAWHSRKLNPEEKLALRTYLANDRHYKSMQDTIAKGEAFVVIQQGKQEKTVFVPGKWTREEYQVTQAHHVFTHSVEGFRYQGKITDKPQRYYDLDGDAYPEVFTNDACDGECLNLWSVSRGVKILAEYGGH